MTQNFVHCFLVARCVWWTIRELKFIENFPKNFFFPSNFVRVRPEICPLDRVAKKSHELRLWRQVVVLSLRAWRKRRSLWGKVGAIVSLECPTIRAVRTPAARQASQCINFLWIVLWVRNGWNSCNGTEWISKSWFQSMPQIIVFGPFWAKLLREQNGFHDGRHGKYKVE